MLKDIVVNLAVGAKTDPAAASAIGKLPQGFVQNAADIGGYARSINAGKFATARGLALSTDAPL